LNSLYEDKSTDKKERFNDPQKRDDYLRSMTETSEMMTNALREHPLEHTCHTREDGFCEPCSIGQQAAELADEGIGIEGIDF
jgi:hypothetical protein